MVPGLSLPVLINAIVFLTYKMKSIHGQFYSKKVYTTENSNFPLF